MSFGFADTRRTTWSLALLVALALGCSGAPVRPANPDEASPLEGAPGDTRSATPPQAQPITPPARVELPAFGGCGVVSGGYLPHPETPQLRLDHHVLQVVVVPADELATVTDAVEVEALAEAKEVLLAVDPSWELTQAAIAVGDAAPQALTCQLGTLHETPYARLVLPSPLPKGEGATIHVGMRAVAAEFPLSPPQESPVKITLLGQIAVPSTYIASDGWYPRTLGGDATSAEIFVTAPQEFVVLGSGSGRAGEGVWHFDVPKTRAAIGLAVVPAEGLRTGETVAGSVPRFAASPEHPDVDEAFEVWQAMVTFLADQLGPFGAGDLSLAEVVPVRDEAAASPLGVVIVSKGVLRDPALGDSFTFDLLARQWLELAAPIEPRLVEGILQTLGVRFTMSSDEAAAWNQVATLVQNALAIPEDGDRPLHQVSLVDETYVPIVFSKAGAALTMLWQTLGDEVFAAGLRGFSQGADNEGLGVDALQASLEEAAGKDLSRFFDFYFRGTGALVLEASCRDGKIVVKQKRDEWVGPLAIRAMGPDGRPIEVRFDGGAEAPTDASCDGDASLSAPHALVRFE